MATFVVSTKAELIDAITRALPGQIVYVGGGASIDLTSHEPIAIPAGVTLASSRGAGESSGALLYATAHGSRMFIGRGAGIRVTGLRVRGPDPDFGTAPYDPPVSDGITSSFSIEVDNCELSGWSHAAIQLGPNSTRSVVRNNFIHHNRRTGLGYGVVLLRNTEALIEANQFDYNRHAVAATGEDGISYEAAYNVFLGNHVFYQLDMHGGGDRGELNDGAGEWLKIHHNSFYDIDSIIGAIHISGVPRRGATVFSNFFVHPNRARALSQRLYGCEGRQCEPAAPFRTERLISTISVQNSFAGGHWGASRALSDRYLVADVTGDNVQDLIELAVDGAFWVSVADGYGFRPPVQWGKNGGDIGIGRYKTGDFNGDGRADLMSFESNGGFYVWLSREATLGPFVHWGKNGGDIGVGRYQIGDFNGDGRSDVISFENNNKFYVWLSTGSSFFGPQQWGQNGADIPARYKVGDFNGDKKTDVIAFETNAGLYVWLSQGSAFVPFVKWGSNGADIGPDRYRVVDFTRDGRDDVLSFEANAGIYVWQSDGSKFLPFFKWIDTNPR
jgi:hypothetical protein